MCHAFYFSASFYQVLFELDQQLAEQVKQSGCACGGKLHSARYPRKPRGVSRELLGQEYETRFSFCCAVEGCRRRSTPPSVRFLGRKVYLGSIVILLSALEHGLSASRRQHLIESLDLWPQTYYRLARWWRKRFALSPCWRVLEPQFLPPIATQRLPGELLGRLKGEDLSQRLIQLLLLLQSLTSGSCSHYLPLTSGPQKM